MRGEKKGEKSDLQVRFLVQECVPHIEAGGR